MSESCKWVEGTGQLDTKYLIQESGDLSLLSDYRFISIRFLELSLSLPQNIAIKKKEKKEQKFQGLSRKVLFKSKF